MDMFLENSLRSDSEAQLNEIRIIPHPHPPPKKVSDLQPEILGLCLQNVDPFRTFSLESLLIYAYVKEIHVMIYLSFLFRNISPGLPAQLSLRNASQVSEGTQTPLVVK